MRGDGVDGRLRRLRELVLEGAGVSDQRLQRLLRGRSHRALEMIDILAERLLDDLGLGVQGFERRAGNGVELPLQHFGLLANGRQRRVGRLADRGAQMFGMAGDAFEGVGRRAGELLVEGLGVTGKSRQRLLGGDMEALAQRVGMAGDALDGLHADAGVGLADRLGALAEPLDRAMRRFRDVALQRLGLGGHVEHGGARGRGEFVDRAGAMRMQGFREGVACRGEHAARHVRFGLQALGQLLAQRGQGVVLALQRLGLGGHVEHGGARRRVEFVDRAGAMCVQGFREGVARLGEHAARQIGFGMQAPGQILAQRGQGLMQLGAAHRDNLMQAVGLAFKPLVHVFGALAKVFADLVADMAEVFGQRG